MGKTQETRAKIVHSAIELAKELGPEAVSVKQIYERSGISKNTFYQYFNNKEEVFGDTFANSDDEKMAALPEIMLNFDSPLEQFWEFTKIDLDRHKSFGPKLLATLSTQNVLNNSFNFESEDELSPATKVSLSMIKKMQRTGEIANKSDAFLIAKTIIDIVIGTDIRWTKMSGSFDFKKEAFDQIMLVLQPTVEVTNY